MGVSTEKSKVTTNSTDNISADIRMNGQKLKEVTSFKYLGATLCKDGTYPAEVLVRFGSAMAILNRGISIDPKFDGSKVRWIQDSMDPRDSRLARFNYDRNITLFIDRFIVFTILSLSLSLSLSLRA